MILEEAKPVPEQCTQFFFIGEEGHGEDQSEEQKATQTEISLHSHVLVPAASWFDNQPECSHPPPNDDRFDAECSCESFAGETLGDDHNGRRGL